MWQSYRTFSHRLTGDTGAIQTLKIVVALAMPILYSGILQYLDTSVNSFWIGHYLGDAALAGLSMATMALSTIFCVIVGVATATTILLGTNMAEGTPEDIKGIVITGTAVLVLVSSILVIPVGIHAQYILGLLGAPHGSLPPALSYLRTTLFSLPFTCVYSLLICMLRGIGDVRTPCLFLIISVAADVCLNPLLIFGFWNIPAMGITGSALATVISQAATAVAFIVHLYWRNHILCLRRADFKANRRNLQIALDLLYKGLPIAAQSFVLLLQETLILLYVTRFGVVTTAAYGAVLQLWGYLMMPASAVANAVMIIVAQMVGSGNCEGVESVARRGAAYAMIGTLTLVAVLEGLNTTVLGIFLPRGSSAVLVAGHINRVATWSFAISAIPTVLIGAENASAAVLQPFVIVASMMAIRFGAVYALLGIYGSEAIWWSFPASAAVNTVATYVYFKSGRWREAISPCFSVRDRKSPPSLHLFAACKVFRLPATGPSESQSSIPKC